MVLPRHPLDPSGGYQIARSTVTLALLVVLLAPVGLLSSPTAQADQLDTLAARLPNLSMLGTVAATDAGIYLIGGHDQFAWRNLDDILRFDPATGKVARVAQLPAPRFMSEAASDGERIYIFGGRVESDGHTGTTFDILRFDPADNSVVQMGARLPRSSVGAAVVHWDGAFYLFGGGSCPSGDGYTRRCATILRYDPVTDEVTTLPQRLPNELTGAEALLVGSQVYLIGGLESSWHYKVWRFDLATGQSKIMGARLDTGRYGSASFSDGKNLYLFGGYLENNLVENHSPIFLSSWTSSHDVLRYDPLADSFVETGAWLWDERTYGHAVWWNGSAFVLGGDCARERDCLDILEYRLTPGRPREVEALPAQNGVEITWTPPHEHQSVLPVTGYRVYLLEAERGNYKKTLLSEVGLETSFTHDGCAIPGTCSYAVAAVNAAGEGDTANAVSPVLRVMAAAP